MRSVRDMIPLAGRRDQRSASPELLGRETSIRDQDLEWPDPAEPGSQYPGERGDLSAGAGISGGHGAPRGTRTQPGALEAVAKAAGVDVTMLTGDIEEVRAEVSRTQEEVAPWNSSNAQQWRYVAVFQL